MTIMSPSWAVAQLLTEHELADFRPNDIGGDTFLEAWPPTGVGDEAILVRNSLGTTEYGVQGFESQLSVTVRGEMNNVEVTRQRANLIYDALLKTSMPLTVKAGPDNAELLIGGLWPSPPIIQRFDLSERPEMVLIVRVNHDDLVV